MLAVPKDKANRGTQLRAAESILLTICQCRMATLKASNNDKKKKIDSLLVIASLPEHLLCKALFLSKDLSSIVAH
jgi:hypothetical protein